MIPPAPATPRPNVTIEKTKKLAPCERGECARCPEVIEDRTPVVILHRSGATDVAEDVKVTMCACRCHEA